MKKIFCLTIFLSIFSSSAFSEASKNNNLQLFVKSLTNRFTKAASIQASNISEPVNLHIFKKAYPDLIFSSIWDTEKSDWLITVKFPQDTNTSRKNADSNTGASTKTAADANANKNTGTSDSSLNYKECQFYWCDGALLPQSELANKEKYWTLLYYYNYKEPLADPADFTPEQIEQMKNFGSKESRKNGAGTPMFFFDELYDSKTQVQLEKHIITTKFLGKNINIHQRIKEPLQKVESRINDLAKTDIEVQDFIKSLSKNEAYYWRLIANTNRKSFHSLGIALDVQPKSYGGKFVYWSWAKDLEGDNWMLTPLKRRWMPPEKVIQIFEEEGFIWGGKWAIWDNMHFEYHPELIYFSMQ